jgi:hypothetical protein
MSLDLSKIDILLKGLHDSMGKPLLVAQIYSEIDKGCEFGEWNKYTSFLINKGLAEETSDGMFILTSFGFKVNEMGGWILYEKKQQELQDGERGLKIRELLASEKSAKSSAGSERAAWASLILAILLAVWQLFQSNENEGKFNEVNGRLQTLDSIIRQQKSPQLQTTSLRDSLPRPKNPKSFD